MLERLQVTHLRNIARADLRLATCNVFIGANGSGKTSLLEAIFLLSRGKSFRHHQPKRYIQHHQPSVTVHATLSDGAAGATLAIQKQLDATTILRLNQNTVYTQSALTQQLPTLLIDPSSMDMLEQGSASRRQLLDWLAFHMKPGFHPQWLAYQRLLKQRNRLLKQSRQLSSQQRQELAAWDKGLASHAALIHHYRQHVFDAWQPHFQRCVQALLPRYSGKITLSYSAGYDTDTPLNEQLQARMEQDLQQGFTRIGSHRADVQVYWRSSVDQSQIVDQIDAAIERQYVEKGSYLDHCPDQDKNESVDAASVEPPILKEQAANVLSRGEKKLLITALKLSQLPLLLSDDPVGVTMTTSQAKPWTDKQTTVDIEVGSVTDSPKKPGSPLGFTPVVLLDDITAELDSSAIVVLLSTLARLPCQVFITSLTEEILPIVGQFWPNFQLFHVKQGQVSRLTS